MRPANFAVFLVLVAVALCVSCRQASDVGTNSGEGLTVSGNGPESEDTGIASASRPASPVNIGYTLIGTPVVGQPLDVEITVSSSLQQSIVLKYRIDDSRNLEFADNQPQEVAIGVSDAADSRQQVTVLPQRKGRHYLNVSAEAEYEGQVLVTALAIPVQVDSAGPDRQSPDMPDDQDGADAPSAGGER